MAAIALAGRRSTVVGCLCAFSAAAIWGGLYVVSKYVLGYVPPITLVAIRLVIATSVLGLVLQVRGELRVPRGELRVIALSGLIGYTVSLGTQFAGTHLSSAHAGALITSATPAFVAVFAGWLLRERVSGLRWLAIAVATLGVLIVTSDTPSDGSGATSLFGNTLLVTAAITWAFYSVLVKAAMARYSALLVTGWVSAFGVVFTAPLVPIELLGQPSVLALAAVPLLVILGTLYIGVVSTAGAFYLWNKGFELLDASLASLFFFVQPVVGSLLGWLLLGEQITERVVVGAVVIGVGVVLASRA